MLGATNESCDATCFSRGGCVVAAFNINLQGGLGTQRLIAMAAAAGVSACSYFDSAPPWLPAHDGSNSNPALLESTFGLDGMYNECFNQATGHNPTCGAVRPSVLRFCPCKWGSVTPSATFSSTPSAVSTSSNSPTPTSSLSKGSSPSVTSSSPPTASNTGSSTATGTVTTSVSPTFAYPRTIISTVGGTGGASYSGDGNLSVLATFNNPWGLFATSFGIFVADSSNNAVRFLNSSTGVVTTVAGFDRPTAVILDSFGNLIVAESSDFSGRVRMLAPLSSTIRTVAGTSYSNGFSGDGSAATSSSVKFRGPIGLAYQSGILYIADSNNHRVRAISSGGIITTAVGSGDCTLYQCSSGLTGDGGPATSAQLNYPGGLSVNDNILYIADTNNHRIRAVSLATFFISTLAGSGSRIGDGGPATLANLASPFGVAASGNGVWIADSGHNLVRFVNLATGVINTAAGFVYGSMDQAMGLVYNGDGMLATDSRLYNTHGVSVSPEGTVFLADTGNSRIRMLTFCAGLCSQTTTSSQTPSTTSSGTASSSSSASNTASSSLTPSSTPSFTLTPASSSTSTPSITPVITTTPVPSTSITPSMTVLLSPSSFVGVEQAVSTLGTVTFSSLSPFMATTLYASSVSDIANLIGFALAKFTEQTFEVSVHHVTPVFSLRPANRRLDSNNHTVRMKKASFTLSRDLVSTDYPGSCSCGSRSCGVGETCDASRSSCCGIGQHSCGGGKCCDLYWRCGSGNMCYHLSTNPSYEGDTCQLKSSTPAGTTSQTGSASVTATSSFSSSVTPSNTPSSTVAPTSPSASPTPSSAPIDGVSLQVAFTFFIDARRRLLSNPRNLNGAFIGSSNFSVPRVLTNEQLVLFLSTCFSNPAFVTELWLAPLLQSAVSLDDADVQRSQFAVSISSTSSHTGDSLPSKHASQPVVVIAGAVGAGVFVLLVILGMCYCRKKVSRPLASKKTVETARIDEQDKALQLNPLHPVSVFRHPSSPTLCLDSKSNNVFVGSRVTAFFRKGTTSYPGVVVRTYPGNNNSSAKFDIDYDDGDNETMLPAEYVTLEASRGVLSNFRGVLPPPPPYPVSSSVNIV